MPKNPVLTDIPTLRKRARQDIDDGSVTAGYSANRKKVLELLNASLATELVCVLRYRRHHYMAKGIHSQSVAQEFLDHSNEELGHADELAERIVQLGGEPDFAPDGLTRRSHAEYVEGSSLASMIREDLVAERIAIDSYRDIIKFLGDDDPTTRRMMEGILAMEEEHADDLADLLVAFPEQTGSQETIHEIEVSDSEDTAVDASRVTLPLSRVSVDARGVALGILAVLAGLYALSWAQAFVVPLLLGIVISYTLNPLVTWFEERKIPRVFATVVVMASVIGVLGFATYALRGEAQTIIEQLPEAASKLAAGLARMQIGQTGNHAEGAERGYRG